MKKEIDTIVFEFKVLHISTPDQVTERPEIGSYVYGLYLEAAKWSPEKEHLEESAPKVLFNKVPMIWLMPKQVFTANDKVSKKEYSCPVYKTSRRAGTLSTTGHSTNYVLSIDLPISPKHTPDHWIKRGAAMLCQLDD